MSTPADNRPHRRLNRLTGDSVLVSPQRTQRPWQGQVEATETTELPDYDPGCYLCPGNSRAGGQQNPNYQGAWAFDNDFPALLPSAETSGATDTGPESPLLQSSPESGRCRVVCYSPQHQQSLATLPPAAVQAALRCLFSEFAELDADPDIAYVQMFENRGAMMGCSNPHPHAQIWATQQLPDEPAKELKQQAKYFVAQGSPLLVDYLREEQQRGERIVFSNNTWTALVPFWAVWPFEMLLLPQRLAAGPGDLRADELTGLAACLQTALQALNGLFGTAMPYSLGFHPRPSDGRAHPEWQFHAHIYPPLLRSATVRKHMVGFELLGMPQRDLTAEQAAEQLRSALNQHQVTP